MSVSLLAVLVRDISLLIAVLVFSIIFSLALNVNPLRNIVKLKPFIIIILLTSLLQSIFMRSGTVLISISDVTILTLGGIYSGLTVFMRMIILIIFGQITASCGMKNGIQALIQLRIPYEIAFMVYISLHFLPLLARELSDSLIAIQLRGIDIKRISMRKRIKIYTFLFLPVVGGGIIKARDISASMELRGFRAYRERVSLRKLKMRKLDYCAVILIILSAVSTLMYYYFWR
jgi:energy-coupling factor transport system permease protein